MHRQRFETPKTTMAQAEAEWNKRNEKAGVAAINRISQKKRRLRERRVGRGR